MKGSWKNLVRPLLPRRTAPRRILAGPLRGRKIVTSWHDYPAAIIGTTERPLLDWFAVNAQKGQTWLDVGGHYGYTAVALAERVGSDGRVFTFEPIVVSAGCIAQTRVINRLEQMTVLPLGLGCPESMETKRLPIARGMADLTIQNESAAHAWETIQVARFDWLWPRINGGDSIVHGVKIDVQGMELDVLAGMADLLRRQKPALVVELHRGVDRRRFIELLIEAGYSPDAVPLDVGSTVSRATLEDNQSYAFVAAA